MDNIPNPMLNILSPEQETAYYIQQLKDLLCEAQKIMILNGRGGNKTALREYEWFKAVNKVIGLRKNKFVGTC